MALSKRVNVFRKDRHLDSPIIETEFDYIRRFQRNEKALKQMHILLLTKYGGLVNNYSSERFQSDTLRALTLNPPSYTEDVPTLTALTSSSLRVYKVGKEDWYKNASGATIPQFESRQTPCNTGERRVVQTQTLFL